MQIPDRFETEHFRFVNYTQVPESDHWQILEARNHPDIACWMETTDTISWASHQNYVRSLAKRADRVYYGVYEMGGGKIVRRRNQKVVIKDALVKSAPNIWNTLYNTDFSSISGHIL